MKSIIVVTSWWSNCLGLMCLHRLREFAPGREIFVMQAGKSDVQLDGFRRFMPRGVVELVYPDDLPADDSPMREYLAREALRDRDGVWFFDHDTFLTGPAGQWLAAVDELLEKVTVCLCTRRPLPGGGITQPAYWLSPSRWPGGLSSFDPVPFKPKPYARRPDLYRHSDELVVPGKDTLVQVREELAVMNSVWDLPIDNTDVDKCRLPLFPPHIHIGGVHLYTSPAHPPAGIPPSFLEWRRRVVSSFEDMYKCCPPEWIAIEEPELLRRHRELLSLIHDEKKEDA